MKRFGVIALVLILAMSLFSAAYAEPDQIASAYVQGDIEGDVFVQVTVDLADKWSVEYYPFAFYLYDHVFDPAADDAENYQAYGTFFLKADYDSMLATWAENGETYEEKDGCVFTEVSDETVGYYFPIDEDVYIGVIIDKAVDADAVLARISCARVAFEEEE